MKLIIDIPEKTANEIKDNAMFAGTIPSEILWDVTSAIVNGTPIPNNATVGEVFCMLVCKEPICETASYFTIGKDLWNAPYQKGGKDEVN